MAFVWLQDRTAHFLLWKASIFVFGGGFLALFLLDVPGFHLPSLGLGTAAFLVASFSCLAAALSFDGKPVPWRLLPVLVATWIAICLAPHALDTAYPAVIAQSLAAVGFIGGAGWAHWQNRNRKKIGARWGMIVLYGAVAMFFVLRLPLMALAPFPFGAQPSRIEWIAAYVLSLDVAAIVLSFLSIMMAKEKSEAELRAFAFTDALTGLLNRRAFSVDIAKIARRHGHGDIGYCLVMLDLDRFKSLNDSFGHDFGDKVLISFADVARASLGRDDMLYRVGGEEFCLVLPETSESIAVHLANNLRIAFRSSGIAFKNETVPLSVSAGVASSKETGADPALLQVAADEALYRAKRQGRDCVVAATHRGAPFVQDIEWAVA